jgi:DNA-binding MarR family transcriptional regulator
LGRNGPATAASLAAVEHVSQQAIAQNISSLRAAGLIQTAPDPSDGRKSLISLTESGQTLRESIIASRNAWLVHAIDSTIAADELSVLEKAIDLLERLAAARR